MRRSITLALYMLLLFPCIIPIDISAADRKAAGKSSQQAGTVSATEALKRISAHQKAINERLSDMTGKYDKNVVNTLTEMFKKSSVHQSAMGYASSWAGNGVYLPWVNDVRPFYDSHMAALTASAEPLKEGKAKIMKKSDLAYLDNGMSQWKDREKKLASLMYDYTYHLSKKAFFLGEGLKYSGDNRYYSRNTPEFRKQYEPSVVVAKEMAGNAEDVVQESLNKLKEAGKVRLFSAVTSKERINLERGEEECQWKAVFNPRQDIPDSTIKLKHDLEEVFERYRTQQRITGEDR